MCDNLVNDNKLVSMTKKSKIYTILLVITIRESSLLQKLEEKFILRTQKRQSESGRMLLVGVGDKYCVLML